MNDQVAAPADAKTKTEVTAVTMTDGRVVNFAGHERLIGRFEQGHRAEQGREQRRRFLTPGVGYQPGNAQMFHGN